MGAGDKVASRAARRGPHRQPDESKAKLHERGQNDRVVVGLQGLERHQSDLTAPVQLAPVEVWLLDPTTVPARLNRRARKLVQRHLPRTFTPAVQASDTVVFDRRVAVEHRNWQVFDQISVQLKLYFLLLLLAEVCLPLQAAIEGST